MGVSESEGGQPAVQREMVIQNRRGLHARAAAKLVECAIQFDANITITRDGQSVPGTSIMGLLMLTAAQGARITVGASGTEAEDAVAALCSLVDAGFGED